MACTLYIPATCDTYQLIFLVSQKDQSSRVGHRKEENAWHRKRNPDEHPLINNICRRAHVNHFRLNSRSTHMTRAFESFEKDNYSSFKFKTCTEANLVSKLYEQLVKITTTTIYTTTAKSWHAYTLPAFGSTQFVQQIPLLVHFSGFWNTHMAIAIGMWWHLCFDLPFSKI